MSSAPSALRLLVVAAAMEDIQALLSNLSIGMVTTEVRQVNASPLLRQALSESPWDVCLHLPGATFSVHAVLKLIEELGLDLPVLMIASADGRKLALGAMKAGARDVVDADRLERLVPAIQREVDGAQHRAEHRAALEMVRVSEARYRALASNLPGMLFQLRRVTSTNSLNNSSIAATQQFRFMYVSDGCQKLFGRKQHELLESAEYFFSAFETKHRRSLEQALKDSAQSGTLLNWDGQVAGRTRTKWINLRSTPHRFEDGSVEWQGVATNITHSKDAEGELRRSREQLAELSSHLEAVKEEERERIAREIHDELGSILVRLKIEVALISSKLPADAGTLREKARSIEELLNQAMGTASRVARELRPGILKEFGLLAALECQAEDFGQRSGTRCRVECDEESRSMEPDADTSLAVFRIAQEALTNVAKHAGATQVVMHLSRLDSNIVLVIRDNGRGISSAELEKPKSFGLRGIRERVASLAGDFSIARLDNGGTELVLRVPENTIAAMIRDDAQAIEPQRKLF
jgi:two-component system, NarL family, sensor histidine kinase UhpB